MVANSAMFCATPSMVCARVYCPGKRPPSAAGSSSGTRPLTEGCFRSSFCLAWAAAFSSFDKKPWMVLFSVIGASGAAGFGRHIPNPSYHVRIGSLSKIGKFGRLCSRNHFAYGWVKGTVSQSTSTVASTTIHHWRRAQCQPRSNITRFMEPYGHNRTSADTHTFRVLKKMTRHFAISGLRSWCSLPASTSSASKSVFHTSSARARKRG
mmetsp:Transcript_41838/g.107042  ORF Transcript_41838/g.107042 Transcript_41838/m.107042 type:complete len:209 (+) Transcript_41838:430-1056(+)